ncbi:MAG: T9SS type A sorting domain-containing protein, partial [Bacteroidetes bacterium]|nr:T9SS type A sorting domain-containing protein [Bacteroidota bacterium]
LTIKRNDLLPALVGLDSLASVGAGLFIESNDALVYLYGLDNLTAIGGELVIRNNNALATLNGIDHIDPATISYLTLLNSNALSTCTVPSICAYLADGNPAEITANANGCNSYGQVLDACALLPAEEAPTGALAVRILPNPTKGIIQVDRPGATPAHVRLIDSRGSLALSRELAADGQLNLSGLPNGLYFLQLRAGDQVWVKRVVKE